MEVDIRLRRIATRAVEMVRTQGVMSLVNLCRTRYFTLRSLPSNVKSLPVWAQIEVTNVCNLRCTMCAQSADSWQSEFPKKTLNMMEFKRIIDQLPHIQFALLNGVGEPVINPHLIEMIRYGHSKGIKTAFYTNATLLKPELSRRLIETAGFISMHVSMDAGRPETFDRIRVGAKFTEVCRNLETFLRIKSELGKKTPRVTVWMVAMRDRVDEIPLLVNVLEKLGVTELNVKNILEGDETQGERVTAEERQRILQYRAQAEKQGVHLSYAEMPERNVNTRETRTCVDPWRMVYVNATGWINPCCFSFGDKSAYFGNVLQKDFTKIWNNKAYQEFRRDLKTGMPGVCKECPKHGAKWIGEGSLM